MHDLRHDKRHRLSWALSQPAIPRPGASFRVGRESALRRHRHNHLSPQVAAAILAAEKPTEIDLEALQVI